MKTKIEEIKDYCKSFIEDYFVESTDIKVSLDDDILSVVILDTETNEEIFAFQIDNNGDVDFSELITHIDAKLFVLVYSIWLIFNWGKKV